METWMHTRKWRVFCHKLPPNSVAYNKPDPFSPAVGQEFNINLAGSFRVADQSCSPGCSQDVGWGFIRSLDWSWGTHFQAHSTHATVWRRPSFFTWNSPWGYLKCPHDIVSLNAKWSNWRMEVLHDLQKFLHSWQLWVTILSLEKSQTQGMFALTRFGFFSWPSIGWSRERLGAGQEARPPGLRYDIQDSCCGGLM